MDLGGVYMIPGRLSQWSEFTPVSPNGSTLFTTTKCNVGASRSPRLLYLGENFTPVRNLATVSCKRENDHMFQCEIGLPVDWKVNACVMFAILNLLCILST